MSEGQGVIIGCPYAKSSTSPCAARDGQASCGEDGLCIGCGKHPADLLKEAVHKYVNIKEEARKLVKAIEAQAQGEQQ